MTADNPLSVRNEQESISTDPLGAIEKLCQEGKIVRTITFQFTSDHKDYAVIHTHMVIAPTEPAKNIDELNSVLDNLPKPQPPSKKKRAEFVADSQETWLPQVSYYQEAAVISYHAEISSSNPKNFQMIEGFIKQIIPSLPTVTIYSNTEITIYPTAEIAQALAIRENEILTERNQNGRRAGYLIKNFDPSRPATDLAGFGFTDKDIYYMDFSLPQQLWNPQPTA